MESPRSLISGWRGAALAALIAVSCALPGLIVLPTVDRNEAVFAQASAQMLDEHNPTDIRFQDYLRRGSMPAAHWLQAASVAATSHAEARKIWAYRLPSLLGLALLVAATVSGGGRLFGERAGFLSGVLLGTSILGLSLANLATAEALFAAAAAVMLSAFAHLYAAHREGGRLRKRDKLLFWIGLIAAFLVKGPIILALSGLTGLCLIAMDRHVSWLGSLGWSWGLIALAAMAGPWLVAVTVSTVGQFWQGAEAFVIRGSGIGFQTLVAPALLFPGVFLLPFAAAFAFRRRETAGVRLAVAWLVPAWIALECLPGFQLHGAAALYIALAWLGAAGLTGEANGAIVRVLGGAISIATGALIACVSLWLVWRFDDLNAGWLGAGIAAALAVSAGLAGAAAAWRPTALRRSLRAAGLGVAASIALLVVVLPGLDRLWPTQNLLHGLSAAGVDPRGGLARGPVAAAGYAEPSLVFHLGAETQLGDAQTAADAILDSRPAIVSNDQLAAVSRILSQHGLAARTVYRFEGYDPAEAEPVNLSILSRAP